MAVMNVTAGNKAILRLGTQTQSVPGAAGGLVVPFMQDITVNASTGVVRYKTLDSASEKAFTTPSTNQITLNVLVDEDVFFGDGANATNSVANNGLFGTQNNKSNVHFSVAFEGQGSGARYIQGEGFLSGLAPTASQDGAVFITPITIEVDGDLSTDVTP